MRCYGFDRPKEIWVINCLGALLLLGGMLGTIATAWAHQWLQFAGWLVLTFTGAFMAMVYVPSNYPEKLFGFDWSDLIWMALFAYMLVMMNDNSRVSLSALDTILLILGLWAVLLFSRMLSQLSGRVGLMIEYWTRRPSAQIARLRAAAKKMVRSEEIYGDDPRVEGTFYFQPWVPAIEVGSGRRVEIQVLDVSGMFPDHVLIRDGACYRSVREFFILKGGQG